MKNLIIISNVHKKDFASKVKHLKSKINQAQLENWSNLPFLSRVIIIAKTEQIGTALYNYLVNNKLELGLSENRITLKENYLTTDNVHFHPDLKVDTSIDLHFENKLSRSSTKEFTYQLPSPSSPSIRIESFE